MSTSSARVARNSLVLLVGGGAFRAITLILGILITRSLGDVEYGRYVSASAFAAVLVSFTSMGLDRLLTRDMARRPEEAPWLLRDASVAWLALCAVVYVMMVGATDVLALDPQERLLSLLAGAVAIANALSDFLRSVFQAFERMEYHVLTRLSERVFSLFLVLALVLRRRSALSLVSTSLVAAVLALILTFLLISRFVRLGTNPVLGQSWALLQAAIPFGVALTALGVMAQLDVFLVSLFRPDAEVGWYAVAVNVVTPFALLPMSLSTALFPHLSKRSLDDPAHASATTQVSFKWIVLLGLPLGIGLAAVADSVVVSLFGREFANAITPLRILGGGLILMFGRIVLSNALSSMDRQTWVAWGVLMQLVATVLLGLLLIPSLGISGAALTVVGRELLGFALFAYGIQRVASMGSLATLLAGPVLAALAMCAAMWGLYGLGVFPTAVGGVVAYGLALGATRTVSRGEWSQLRQLVPLPRGARGQRDLPTLDQQGGTRQ